MARESRADNGTVTIKQLRKACRILELLKGGWTKGRIASRLRLKPAAISKILGGLGNHLEITLDEADPEHAGRLTARAEEFLSRAHRLLDDYDCLLREKTFGSSRVRVGASGAVIQTFLRDVFRELIRPGPSGRKQPKGGFVERFPHTAVHAVQCDHAASLLRDVVRGVADCGILDLPKGDPLLASPGVAAPLPLFPSGRKGFLYHRDNDAFDQAVRPPAGNLLDALKDQTLICAGPEHDLLDYGRLLPPHERAATRLFVETYLQVYLNVLEKVGVGIGFPEESFYRQDVVQFVPFDALPEDALAGSALAGFREQAPPALHLCLREGWKNPRNENGLSDAAKAVVACIQQTAKARSSKRAA